MAAECKVVDCCDLDDFPLSSSGEGNCPVGWQWDGVSCVRCAIPLAPSLTLTAGNIELEWDVPQDIPYRLERKTAPDGMWVVLGNGVGSIGDSHEFHTDTTVVAGTLYFYRIVVEVSAQCGYIEGESASAVAI